MTRIRNRWRAYAGVAVVWALCAGLVQARAKTDHTLIVVPARDRALQLAFDLASLRSVAVLAYRGDAKTEKPLLHLWTGSAWRHIPFEDLYDNRLPGDPITRTFLIGDEQTLSPALRDAVSWCRNVEGLPTYNVADLVNRFDQTFRFKEKEWQWLAKRHQLQLLDVNEPRRRFNPYDMPRSKTKPAVEPRRQKPADADEPAPAVLIDEVPDAGASATDAPPAEPEESPAHPSN